MKRIAAALVLLAALGPLASHAGEGDDEIRAQRGVRGEPSVLRQVLALPYDIVALTGWPLGKTLDWMEDVNFPAYVHDFVLHPFNHIRRGPSEP